LPKHHQSKALGTLTDFSGSPSTPKVDPLETRVTTLERAVNEILFQIADISQRLDQPIRNQESGQGTSQKPPKPQTSQPPEPEPEEMTEAEVAALADRIFDLLSDGTPRSKKAIIKAVECQSHQYQKARLHLIDTGRMPAGNLNEMIPGQICNVPGGLAIWTQAQIDAELDRRKARDAARENETTDADEPSAGR
jgi:hypothetical protein